MGPALDIRQKFKKEMSWNRRLIKRVAAIDENWGNWGLQENLWVFFS